MSGYVNTMVQAALDWFAGHRLGACLRGAPGGSAGEPIGESGARAACIDNARLCTVVTMSASSPTPPNAPAAVSSAPGPAPTPPPSPWLVLNVISQLAFGLLAMTLCLPSMQEWGAIFGAQPSQVQLTFSAYVLSYGVLQVLYGPLSDRHGRRRILIVGLSIAALGSAAAALAPDIETLAAARALQGAGAAAGMAAGRAAVQDLFQGPQRTRVMAYVGMAMGVCPPLAIIIGGQLHVQLGWQSNFVLVTLCALGLIVAAWRGLPGPPPAPAVRTHWLRDLLQSYARLLREPVFLLHVAILALGVAAFYAYLSGAPLVLGSYGVGPDHIGWYTMSVPIAYIVGNFATTRLAHRRGPHWLMRRGQGLNVAGLVLMVGLGLAGVDTPLVFALPLVLMGLGHGLLVPTCLARTVGLLPALAGAAAAATGLMQQILGAIGGYSVGWVSLDGVTGLGLLMLGYTLASVVALMMLRGR